MRERILRYMTQHTGDYASGEQMAMEFGISRAAVWKHIEVLKKMGCDIESKPNAGYRLTRLPDGVQEEIIRLHDEGGLCERVSIVALETTSSTNEHAKQLAAAGQSAPTVVIANAQTEGKGRLGRSWEGEAGNALMFSLLLRPELALMEASKIGLIAGVAVAQALETLCGLDAKLKWPNDVLIKGKKVCGILTEMGAQCDGIDYVVLGIGVNVNQQGFSHHLLNIATSVFQHTGQVTLRAPLLLAILDAFFELYDAWMASGDFEPLIQRYTKRSMLVGQQVNILQGSTAMSGECVGFDRDGFLVVSIEGKRRRIMAGDVSVRSEGTYD